MTDVTQRDPVAFFVGAAPNRRRKANAETLKAYESDWQAFHAFCTQRGFRSMPAEPYTVARYLAESAQTRKASTVARRLQAVNWGHARAGFPSPTRDTLVRNVMAGVRRLKATTPERKQPLSVAVLRKMFATASDDLRTPRDRALVLVGCAACFSRRELVGLRYQDVQFTDAGLVITIPKSESNPDGQGPKVEIPYSSDPELCPVRALAAWLERSHIRSGSLFPALGRWQRKGSGKPLCDHQLANIIKRLAARAGFKPAAFSVSSLRATFAIRNLGL